MDLWKSYLCIIYYQQKFSSFQFKHSNYHTPSLNLRVSIHTILHIYIHVHGTHFSLEPFESFSYEEAPDISLNVSGCIIHVLLSRASLFWMINSERINYMYIKVKKNKIQNFFYYFKKDNSDWLTDKCRREVQWRRVW